MLALSLAAPPGCTDGDGGPEASAATPRARPRGPALPFFEGRLLDGTRASTDLLRRRRGVVFVFSPRSEGAEEIARLVAGVRTQAEDANVTFLGVSVGLDQAETRAFLRRHGLDFPVFDDTNAAIARKLPLEPGKAALLLVDAAGHLMFGFAGLDPQVDESTYETAVREQLHLVDTASAEPTFGVRPRAPAIEIRSVAGEPFDPASLDGRVAVVVFFLHTCPHCHDALRFLHRLRGSIGSDDLAIVPVSVQNKVYLVEDMGKSLGLDLPLYLDPTRATQKAWGHGGGVPDVFVVGRDGRVHARHRGMSPRIEALLQMEIRQALGVENPLLLDRVGYSGQQACQICHAPQHETWSLTNHAFAFDTLVQHGEDRNPECLPCHVVGWEKPGGYGLDTPEARLEGVQCESCHGRGGPHQSPEFVKAGFQQACLGCHNETHSLRFDFAERLPLVSHAANLAALRGLDLEGRKALFERRERRERQLFTSARFVGSASCADCHAREHEIWSTSGHARSFETLAARGESANTDCQRCHTTGFGEDGGFPVEADARAHVGCESCHGPGGDHVGPDAARRGTILALTDKCDSCVILQICGSCHDDENDPRFEFELIDKLDRIRHGFRDRPAEAAAE